MPLTKKYNIKISKKKRIKKEIQKGGCQMIGSILKRDLKHKFSVNCILFVFMLLAIVFISSSVNNIMVVMNATKYCMDKGNMGDVYVNAYEKEGEPKISDWLDRNDKGLVTEYSKNEGIILTQKNFISYAGKTDDKYNLTNTILLQSQWKDNMIVYDQNANPLTIQDGKIAMQQRDMDQNKLKVGDTLEIKVANTTKKFTIIEPIKDPAFGGDFVGMSRYFVSDHDFDEIAKTGVGMDYNYNISVTDTKQFITEFTKEGFSVVVTIKKSMFEFSYVMSLIIASVFIIIGICLIVIAFLILRFTIVFTLEEEYREIGIMKAIGIKSSKIKNIYLIKYFVLIVIAAVIGLFVSIPASNLMLSSISKNMMMSNSQSNLWVNIVCCIVVSCVVMGLCYMCTRRLKKFSAIQTIRGGQTGERYKKLSILQLHKTKRMTTPTFMAVNDVLSKVSRYVVLILTFAIGTILIILPTNIISTIQSDEMKKNFCISKDMDFFIRNEISSGEDLVDHYDVSTIQSNIEKIEEKFKEKDINVSINTMAFYSLPITAGENMQTIMCLMPLGAEQTGIELYEGEYPKYDDEIAMSDKIMKNMEVQIGDYVDIKIKGENKRFLITGSYANYMQMGSSILFSSKQDVSGIMPAGNWAYQCQFLGDEKDNITLETLREKFTDMEFYDADEFVESQIGDIVSRLGSVKALVIGIVCAINVLITVLMVRIFMMNEKSQIAMLRSIGYSCRKVRAWQMHRITIVLVLGILLGIISSFFLNGVLVKPIFYMMGATHIQLQVNPMEVYVLYPIVLLVVISIAAYISSGIVKKFHLMDINNQD